MKKIEFDFPPVLNHRARQQRELKKQELALQWEIMELEDLADTIEDEDIRSHTLESVMDRIGKLAETRRKLALEETILINVN